MLQDSEAARTSKASNHELIEITNEFYRALSRSGDGFPSLRHHLSEAVTWTMEGVAGAVPFAGTSVGVEGVEGFFSKHHDAIEDLRLTIRYQVAHGPRVNCHLIEEGVIVKTGKPYRMEVMNVWRFDDSNKVTLYRNYNDTYAMFHAFDPNSDPALSISIYDADYRRRSAGTPTVNAVGAVEGWYCALRGEGNILDCVDDDIVFILPGARGITPFAGQYEGRGRFSEFLSILAGSERIEHFVINPDSGDYVVDGSIVDDEMVERAFVFSTGRVFNIRGAHSMIISDTGRIRSWRSYNDTYEIAKAFGSSD